MNKLENTIVSMAEHMLVEMRNLMASPYDTEDNFTKAKEFNITVDDLRNNEIANKMIEIKTLTQISLIPDSGLTDQAMTSLHEIEDECNRLLRTHSWICH